MYYAYAYTCMFICSVAKLCLTLCNHMGYSLAGSSVHAIFQAGMLKWVQFTPPRDLPNPKIKIMSLASPALAGKFFWH